MKPAAFDMVRPETLAEALAFLGDRAEDAKVIAGGQSLVPVMNFRLAAPRFLIDLNRIKALAGIRLDGDMLRIGAMTRQSALMENPLIAHAPLLALALPHIGHVQTRSRGTIGGSLAHADPSAELPLIMVTLDATLTIESRRGGRRVMPARQFFTDAMVTELASDRDRVSCRTGGQPLQLSRACAAAWRFRDCGGGGAIRRRLPDDRRRRAGSASALLRPARRSAAGSRFFVS